MAARTTALELEVSIASRPPGTIETAPFVTQRSLRSTRCNAGPDAFCAKAQGVQMTIARIANARFNIGVPLPCKSSHADHAVRYDAGRIVAPTVAGSSKIIWTDIV